MTKKNGGGLVRAVIGTLKSNSGGSHNITGAHKLDILKALSSTDSKAFSPTNPGDLSNYSSVEILHKIPEAVSADDADLAAIGAAQHERKAEGCKFQLADLTMKSAPRPPFLNSLNERRIIGARLSTFNKRRTVYFCEAEQGTPLPPSSDQR